MKKAQVSLFLLVALALISVIGFLSIHDVKLPHQERLALIPEDTQPAKQWFDLCLEQAAKSAIYLFGQQKGYYVLPQPYLPTDILDIPFYVFYESDQMLSHEGFEAELSRLMTLQILEMCTDFEGLEEQGFAVEYEFPFTSATILESQVVFDVEFPIIIKKDNKVKFSEFSYTFPIRIGHVLDVSRILVDSIIKSPSSIDLTLLSEQDVGIAVFQHYPCTQSYMVVDEQSQLSEFDEPYIHYFAVEFSEDYCDYDFVRKNAALIEENE